MLTASTSFSRLRIFTIACSLIYAVVFVLMLVLHPGSEKFYKDFNNIYQIIPPFFAGVCGIVYAQKGKHSSKPRQIGWLLIGIGALVWGFGQAAWTWYETIRGVEVPSPGLADYGYLGGYPFLIAGVILLFGTMPIAGRARLLLDSAIAGSSVGILSWYFLVQKLWGDSEATLLGKLIGISYPLGDVAVLFTALALLSGSNDSKSLRRSSFFLACGMALVALADTLFNFYNFTPNGYQTGSWFDWGWSFGWLLVGYAALSALWWPRAEDVSTHARATPHPVSEVSSLLRSLTFWGLARVLAPYAFAATAMGFVALHDYHQPKHGTHYISASVFMLALWLILLVVLRQVLTLLENQSLTIQLRSFNANLEQIVSHRTQQLTSLHQLTKAINNTLVIDQVLEAATHHTQRALDADAVVLRLLDENAESQDTVCLPIAAQCGLEEHPEILEYINGQPIVDHVTEIALPAKWRGEAKDAKWLRAPLLWQGRTIGVISVLRWNNSFGTTDVDTLESIGVEVGTAYQNARTYSLAIEAADRDPVTGLFNHRAVHQRMEAEFGRASRQNRPLSVIMMDLNNFKLFNDTYGHPIGDQVLKRVAYVLEVECRKFDILARYGGDEFIAILPDTDEPLALVVAQRLRTRMSQEGFQKSGDERTIPVTLSFGVATYPTDSANRHELLTIADANLYAAKLSDEGIRSSSETQRSSRELRADSSFAVLDAMVTAIDNKDRYTRRHSEDVTEYSLWIAQELGFSEETMRVIRVGGLLHDVGKIGVPEDILHKPGRLTNDEYDVMKRHPELGALIVAGVPGMDAITDIVRSHHERWDGKGYPDGRAGEDTPLLGRLLAVADAFSAMTTARPYRQGLEWGIALEEIRSNSGTQFDPKMATAFLNAAHQRRKAREGARTSIANEKLLQRRAGDDRDVATPHNGQSAPHSERRGETQITSDFVGEVLQEPRQ